MTLMQESTSTSEPEDPRTLVKEGVDYITFKKDNKVDVEKFVGKKIEELNPGIFGFGLRDKSARTFYGDYLIKVDGEVYITPPHVFKKEYRTEDKS